MTPKEALDHLLGEFVNRFNCDAEGCTKSEKTHEAINRLVDALGLDKTPCPGRFCELNEDKEAP